MGIFDDQWDAIDPDGLVPLSTDDTSMFVPERGLFADLFSSLYRGTGRALSLYGKGSNLDTLASLGSSIERSRFAKPDESQYYETNTPVNQILTGAAESVPTSAPLMIGGILGGAVAGAPGAAAGLAATATPLARGLYEESLDSYIKQNPYSTPEEAERYALMSSAIEVGTETLGAGIDLLTFKLGGKITSNALKAAVTHGIIDPEEVLGSVAKKTSVPWLLGKMGFGASTEGGEEVVAEYLHSKVDTAYEMPTEAPDYFKTFLIGAVASAPFNVAGNYVEEKNKTKIRENLNKGLASEDIEQRTHTANQIYDTMYKASPEAAQLWKDYAELNVAKGPLSLTDPILSSVSSELNVKKMTDAGIINQITKAPEKILEEAGIPTTPEAIAKVDTNFSTNPYGPEAVPTSSPTEPIKPQWAQDLPESPKEKLVKAEADLQKYTDTIKVPMTLAEKAKQSKATTTVETKITPLKKLKQTIAQKKEAIPPIAPKEQLSPEAPKTPTESPRTLSQKQAAKKAANVATKEAISQKVEGEVVAPVKTEEELKIIEKAQARLRELNENIANPSTPEVEVAQDEIEIEAIENQLNQSDDTVVPRGAVNTVDKAGNITRATYDRKGWVEVARKDEVDKKGKKKVLPIYKNDNAVIEKLHTSKFKVTQKDENGTLQEVGEYYSLGEAKAAMSAGLSPKEFYRNETKKASIREARAARPFTPEEKEVLATLNYEKVFNTVTKGQSASHIQDAAAEGIQDAVKTFAKRKDKTLDIEQWATSVAKFRIREAHKKVGKNELQGFEQEGDEGSSRGSIIENTGNRAFKDALPPAEEKKAKVAVEIPEEEKPSEVKKVTVSDEEKARILADHKATLEKKKAKGATTASGHQDAALKKIDVDVEYDLEGDVTVKKENAYEAIKTLETSMEDYYKILTCVMS